MRQITMIVCLMLAGNLVFGQKRVDVDPSYSVNNYKHPNKAAHANKHSLDKPIQLQTAVVTDNGNYKHPASKGVVTSRATISTRKEDKTRKSEKHPLGL